MDLHWQQLPAVIHTSLLCPYNALLTEIPACGSILECVPLERVQVCRARRKGDDSGVMIGRSLRSRQEGRKQQLRQVEVTCNIGHYIQRRPEELDVIIPRTLVPNCRSYPSAVTRFVGGYITPLIHGLLEPCICNGSDFETYALLKRICSSCSLL